jgi:hypothetical protein
MIGTGLAVLSLTPPDPPVERDAALPMETGGGCCHPRYHCEDHLQYIAGYALPPYIAG